VFLVDTSVWIEVFRRQSPLLLDDFIDFDEIVTCWPVIQEVLQGFRDEHAYALAREAMTSLPIVESPLGAPLFEDAVRLYRDARRRGFTIRSGVDCLIAACALRNDLGVLHRDRDFEKLARISALRVTEIQSRRR
jgi:predicted nucleic acid-binding protein